MSELDVVCPYCGHTEKVRVRVSPSVTIGWGPTVLFMSAKYGGASGIEHHCPALRSIREKGEQGG